MAKLRKNSAPPAPPVRKKKSTDVSLRRLREVVRTHEHETYPWESDLRRNGKGRVSKAEKLFEAGLELVESASIRKWATTAHNRPIFIQMVEEMRNPSAHKVATLIVANAIGL